MRLAVRSLDGPEVLDLLSTRFDPTASGSPRRPRASCDPTRSACLSPVGTRRSRLPAPARSARRSTPRRSTSPSLPHSCWQERRAGLLPLRGPRAHLARLDAPSHAKPPPLLALRPCHRDRSSARTPSLAPLLEALRGVNLGAEARGRPVDPTVSEQEREAEELSRDLAVTAGAAIYRVGVYVETLAEHSISASRETMLASDARLDPGAFAQRTLWESSLPLARDAAHRTRRYLTRNVADTWPLVSTSCGSPEGLALGYAQPPPHARAARPRAPQPHARRRRSLRRREDHDRQPPHSRALPRSSHRRHRPRRPPVPRLPHPRRRPGQARRTPQPSGPDSRAGAAFSSSSSTSPPASNATARPSLRPAWPLAGGRAAVRL
jgi:hypothetical protein